MKKLRYYIAIPLILMSTIVVARPVNTLQLRSLSIINRTGMQTITVALLGKLAIKSISSKIAASTFVREGGAGITLSTNLS